MKVTIQFVIKCIKVLFNQSSFFLEALYVPYCFPPFIFITKFRRRHILTQFFYELAMKEFRLVIYVDIIYQKKRLKVR